tara:strand:+ start:170 stop:586 length:417 start_codon:yes stop_codon:yes gene_type:complete
MTSRSSGFTLIELLVVVAVLGIISAIGVVSYSGYSKSAKRKTAENIMQQISLAQTEYYSDYFQYYTNSASCTPSTSTSRLIEKNLLDGDGINPSVITEDIGFNFCVDSSKSPYLIKAANSAGCNIKLDKNLAMRRSGC